MSAGRYVIPYGGWGDYLSKESETPLHESIFRKLKILLEVEGLEFAETKLRLEIKWASQMINDFCHQKAPNSVHEIYIPLLLLDLYRLADMGDIASIQEGGAGQIYVNRPDVGAEMQTLFEKIKPFLNKYRKAFFK